MDKVLKQRLIGASILIALAVIFIPMLFDAPDEQRMPREMTLDLPEPSGERPPIRRLPIGPDQARRLQPESAPGSSQASEPEPDRAAGPEISEFEEPYEPTERPVVEADSDERSFEYPIGEPIDIVAPADIDPEEIVESRDQPSTEARPDAEQASAPQPVAIAAADDNGWLVQVASFGSQATAGEIVERLAELGHMATSELFVRGDSTLHRVRTGPYRTREDAERARGQIDRTVAGIDPVVLAGPAPSAEDSEAVAGFAVQVGSFASRNNAVRLLGQLDDHGFDAFIHEDLAGSRAIWRVRVGPFSSREDAVRKLAEITERAGLEGLVVSHP
ncbi:MAG: SPOR domain-containing protein [Wenzhouxiangella sp.]